MNWIMYFLGAGMMLFSLMVLAAAKGGIHEVYFAVLFGSGAICIGLGGVIQHLIALAQPPVISQRRSVDLPLPSSNAETERVVRTYKGRDIIKTAKGYRVGQREFEDLVGAEYHIDRLKEGGT